jgi:peptidoglycan hydrolase CwlO-like protein
MRKILLLIFFVTLSKATYSQSEKTNDDELIVMTKEKHEALRRDIENYKLLLVEYQKLKIDYEILQIKVETQKKQLDSLDYNKIVLLEEKIKSTQQKIAELNNVIRDKDVSYQLLNRSYYKEKNKNIRKVKIKEEAVIWKITTIVFFISIFIVAGQ